VEPCLCLRCTSLSNSFLSSRNDAEANTYDLFSVFSGPLLQDLTTPRTCSTDDLDIQYSSAADRAGTPFFVFLFAVFNSSCGPGSSVGIATGYGLDGPGIESRWGRDFSHTPRPALGLTQPAVQWVPGLSRGQKAARA
jgi:hypothetical protein